MPILRLVIVVSGSGPSANWSQGWVLKMLPASLPTYAFAWRRSRSVTLALPDAQSVEDLTALLTSAGER